jgi:hypothetical protein
LEGRASDPSIGTRTKSGAIESDKHWYCFPNNLNHIKNVRPYKYDGYSMKDSEINPIAIGSE